jgi:hypothetical protein
VAPPCPYLLDGLSSMGCSLRRRYADVKSDAVRHSPIGSVWLRAHFLEAMFI